MDKRKEIALTSLSSAAVDADRQDELRGLFEANKQEFWSIGEVVEGSGIRVTA